MIETPIFNPRFEREIVEGEGIFFLSEEEANFLTGSFYVELAKYINGRDSTDKIADLLYEREDIQASLAEYYYAIEIMSKKGYIINQKDAPKGVKNNQEWIFWDKLQIDQKAKNTRSSSCLNLSSVSTNGLRDALRLTGIELTEDNDSSFQIVLVDDFSSPELKKVNQDNLSSKRPWILIKPVGGILWFGGVFTPYESACWACLEQRISANREVETFINKDRVNGARIVTSKGFSSASLQLTWNILAIELVKWLSSNEDKGNRLTDTLLTYDLATHSTQKHHIARRPQCESCGEDEFINPTQKPIVLQENIKKFTQDGGHRSATPDETLNKYKHHISPITGVVSMLDNITPGNKIIHSYIAGHNSAVEYESIFTLKKGLRSKSAGKGMTEKQAQVSGMCEAIERYSGLYRSNTIRVRGSYANMKDDCIHPKEYLLFSQDQYSTRNEWNQNAGHFQVVPFEFDENKDIEWTPIYSLTEENFKYFPTAYCYYSYNKDKANFYCWADSNGNAAGNSMEEAILQGFLELIERDAVAIWWYNRISRPAVDLDSFNIPYCEEMKQYYKNDLNRDLWVLDLTTDFGIPVFAAISRRNDKPIEDILFGFGAHFDPKVAVLRALTELNQFMPAVMNVNSPSDPYLFDDKDSLKWWRTATIESQTYVLPNKNLPLKTLSDYEFELHNDIKEDVLMCKKMVEDRGMEMLVLDQTQPDIKLPVVKVIVPGMRHFWRRLAPGRLYDVPVEMGWLEEPLEESELNPIPMFI
ncbi:MAG: ribosomal protein S12 methylthiotransferase accessory factor [Salibacteraceae bacterium]|jgi:ribosomal protein S12 methylthiotransferase accessory factor